ncbi:MAG TPA: GGDEF domain-containing protein [Spirochaetota bacterium]|nr:MAG: Phytochrome-like protein cph2 [Spirochaetes bacterium ADurb.Bin133]HNZ27339.1 GGDEF domain-containing protein [Spirochaetota bacterium]HPY88574.1 GGDEF domain-containing protein [Spirochaetota bacterium]HQB60463.1 GGDEF domain-containing protein [Spirochaetota bacterium]
MDLSFNSNLETQNLKEIIEVAKQISSSLEISYILKNVNYIVMSKFNSLESCFVLPKDIDDYSPVFNIFRGNIKEIVTPGFDSIAPLVDFFDKNEFNQINFPQFCKYFPDKKILKEIEKINPDFLIPLRSDKGIIGVFMQGKRSDNLAYSMQDLEFCINIMSFTSIAIENANLYRQATVDRMTKLYTHHQFQKRLEEEIKKGHRYDYKFSLIMFDIDHFKKFNDVYGHLQGDIIIKEIAKLMVNSVRDVDFPSRYGGEEFIAILPESDIKASSLVAERLRQNVERYDFPGEGGPFKVTISAGVIEFKREFVKRNEDIIERVDKALYFSKQNGRNRVSLGRYDYEPSDTTTSPPIIRL